MTYHQRTNFDLCIDQNSSVLAIGVTFVRRYDSLSEQIAGKIAEIVCTSFFVVTSTQKLIIGLAHFLNANGFFLFHKKFCFFFFCFLCWIWAHFCRHEISATKRSVPLVITTSEVVSCLRIDGNWNLKSRLWTSKTCLITVPPRITATLWIQDVLKNMCILGISALMEQVSPNRRPRQVEFYKSSRPKHDV